MNITINQNELYSVVSLIAKCFWRKGLLVKGNCNCPLGWSIGGDKVAKCFLY